MDAALREQLPLSFGVAEKKPDFKLKDRLKETRSAGSTPLQR